MSNYLIILIYIFAAVLLASCSDDKKSESQIFYETHISELLCGNNDLLACWEVSKNSCEETFMLAINHCITVESKFVLDQREKGKEVIDPVCLTNKLIDNLEVDENTAEKCDRENYSKNEAWNKMDDLLSN